MRIFNHIWVFLSALLIILSCEQIQEIDESANLEEGKDVTMRICYGSNVDEVLVSKAGLTAAQESAIYSIYIMTFNQNGARTNNPTDALFYRTDAQTSDRIWVDQSSEGNYSKGYIQFNAKTGANTTVYAVANVNTPALSGLYSLSSADLDKVTSLSELEALTVGLNNKAVSRGSQMMMFGVLKESETATEPKKITINSSRTVQEFGTLYFERLDAKVIFNVSIAEGVSDAEFDLHTWQVFNVPYNAHLVSQNELGKGLDPDNGLEVFDTSASNQFDNGNSFTFYMLENNLSPETELTDYSQREAKNKEESGAYSMTDGSWTWQYAPAQSTYVQIKGRLSQKVTNGSTTDLIHADVIYNVHLGDFGSSANNFWTKSNTEYTYNVYIKGVNNIRVEVTTSNDDNEGITENQPGAEGNVVIASGGNIYEVDAHYSQMLVPFTYNQTFLDAMGGKSSIDDLTWYVSTPYSEGTYEAGKNDDDTRHYDKQYLDYKWAEFYISHTETMVTYGDYLEWLRGKGRATLSGGEYTKTNPFYLDEFVSELKTWYNYMSGASTQKPALITPGTVGSEQTIYVTIFVNEFYYENGNPLTNDGDIPAMVRKVVNTEDRYMHILSNVDYSADGASSVTNSAATIIQKPIRSIYNIPDFGLLDGYDLIWGTETISEKYGAEEDFGFLYGNINKYSADDSFNGRYNTYILWNGQSWEDRMTISSDNVWTMKNATTPSANAAVYACLARNRDENGNGTVDTEEMKWYMAAIDQLQYLYIGENVIHPDAKLIPAKFMADDVSATDLADANKYHYLSSTYTTANNGGGYILWAEEGLSTSGNFNRWNSDPYSQSDVTLYYGTVDANNSYVRRPVRCLRNLGIDENLGSGMNTLFENANNVISPTYLNPDALRNEKWATATLTHADNTTLNLPYIGGFEYYRTETSLVSGANFWAVVPEIESGEKCPEGYRIPNQREMALLYIANVRPGSGVMWWTTSYSWYKNKKKEGDVYTSAMTNTMTVTTELASNQRTRCIRDVDAANTASSYNNGGSLIE